MLRQGQEDDKFRFLSLSCSVFSKRMIQSRVCGWGLVNIERPHPLFESL
jgi:hypothetical protein